VRSPKPDPDSDDCAVLFAECIVSDTELMLDVSVVEEVVLMMLKDIDELLLEVEEEIWNRLVERNVIKDEDIV